MCTAPPNQPLLVPTQLYLQATQLRRTQSCIQTFQQFCSPPVLQDLVHAVMSCTVMHCTIILSVSLPLALRKALPRARAWRSQLATTLCRAVLLYVQKARLSPRCPSCSRCCLKGSCRTSAWCSFQLACWTNYESTSQAHHLLLITSNSNHMEVLETRHIDCCAGAFKSLLWIIILQIFLNPLCNCVIYS